MATVELGNMVAAALVGVVFYSIANQRIKNSGDLTMLPEPTTDATEPYADVDGLTSRTPNQIAPPDTISTSLLPADNSALGDDDFAVITPDKLNQINFLNAGWALGRDTNGGSTRLSTYDLRSEPMVPKSLTPENNAFLNSTIEFTNHRRAFEPEPAGQGFVGE